MKKLDRMAFRRGFLQTLAEKGITPSEFGEMCCQSSLQKSSGVVWDTVRGGSGLIALSAIASAILAAKIGKAIGARRLPSIGNYTNSYRTLELAKAYENAASKIRRKNKTRKKIEEKGYDSRIMSDTGF